MTDANATQLAAAASLGEATRDNSQPFLCSVPYSWERSSNGSSWTIVSDDNTTSYTTDTSLAIGQYMYRCNVSNDGGSVVSNIAIVDVYGKYILIFVYAITCTLFTEVLDHPCNFKYVV